MYILYNNDGDDIKSNKNEMQGNKVEHGRGYSQDKHIFQI